MFYAAWIGYKRLATACGGTARISQLRVSDIAPCFVIDVYYFTYNRAENYYEFGALRDLSANERKLMREAKRFLQNLGYTFLNRRDALRPHQDLTSDLNEEGGATLYDALFADTGNHQHETKRFNDESLLDPTGKKISWEEYYDSHGQTKGAIGISSLSVKKRRMRNH